MELCIENGIVGCEVNVVCICWNGIIFWDVVKVFVFGRCKYIDVDFGFFCFFDSVGCLGFGVDVFGFFGVVYEI